MPTSGVNSTGAEVEGRGGEAGRDMREGDCGGGEDGRGLGD